MAATKAPAKKGAAAKAPKAAKARLSLGEVMKEMEKAGTAQARKTYARHGAKEPMFGVAFAVLGKLQKRIGVDQELALALWGTGNFDARNLAFKIADPALMTPGDLDRWAREIGSPMVGWYLSSLVVEGPHAPAKAAQWLASKDTNERHAGWGLLGQMAMRDETRPDAWFAERLAGIERAIHAAPNEERGAMNMAVIQIGCRSPGLRKAATAAAKRIGRVDVDHGDTACKTPDAADYIDKCWARCDPKKFPSPAAAERARESMRTRC